MKISEPQKDNERPSKKWNTQMSEVCCELFEAAFSALTLCLVFAFNLAFVLCVFAIVYLGVAALLG